MFSDLVTAGSTHVCIGKAWTTASYWLMCERWVPILLDEKKHTQPPQVSCKEWGHHFVVKLTTSIYCSSCSRWASIPRPSRQPWTIFPTKPRTSTPRPVQRINAFFPAGWMERVVRREGVVNPKTNCTDNMPLLVSTQGERWPSGGGEGVPDAGHSLSLMAIRR